MSKPLFAGGGHDRPRPIGRYRDPARRRVPIRSNSRVGQAINDVVAARRDCGRAWSGRRERKHRQRSSHICRSRNHYRIAGRRAQGLRSRERAAAPRRLLRSGWEEGIFRIGLATQGTGGNRMKSARPIRIVGEIAFVSLTRGYEAIIDASDVPLVSGVNWQAKITPRSVYATRSARREGRRRAVSLHATILGSGPDHVDHVNGNGLDNRRANLRRASRVENGQNRRLNTNNASGFKGVSFRKDTGKWRAEITLRGQRMCLGNFEVPSAAHAAYCEAARKFFGNFARPA